ncbi:MAG: hypothetical protein ACYDCM_16895 [Candidatus Acidiferrales bacterium]
MRQNDRPKRLEPALLPLAVRAYPEPQIAKQEHRYPRKPWRHPKAMLVFDTESRVDATQCLTFGSYRFIVNGQCREEGLFYADDLPAADLGVLKKYVETHHADAAHGNRRLLLLTLSEFLDKLYFAAYKGRCLLVGFNLPFDFSRLACDVLPARGRFAGGFSLGIWRYIDNEGQKLRNKFRPRIGVKHIDSKRALKGFTGRDEPDTTDLIPEGSETGKPEAGYKFRGHFLDLRTLAFALTDKSHSLESACKDFGVEHLKQPAERHGEVTEDYIDYNRRDVLATSELAIKLLEEYDNHELSLQPTKAYSPASIGKAYLHKMGIEPILKRQPDFPKKYLGFAQSAFFGGRTSAHIRKVAMPVVYTDFLSMYPTVNSLMKLWRFVIAGEIRVVDHCQEEISQFLGELKAHPEKLFKSKTWERMPAFVKVIPDGDILPCRGRYNAASRDWQVGVNYLYSGKDNPNHALWFSLPDVIVSVLLTRKLLKIVDAFRIEAHGTLPDLRSVKLRSAVDVDPMIHDFFKVVIEERQRLSGRSDLSETEKERLNLALKVLANAASYGIYAEMIRQESDKKIKTTCYGIDDDPFVCKAVHPEVPGEYCFPPLASLITGAARLMLALLEHSVTELGGTYVMEDTDSMAIVATENGNKVPCPGGPLRTEHDGTVVKALSWVEVLGIAKRFEALNSYNRNAVPGSILKIENDNFDLATKKPRQIYCVAISAKRYAPFLKDERGNPILLQKGINNKKDRWSEHGLGHLLNPIDPENEDRKWIGRVWLNIIQKTLNLPIKVPEFKDFPAIGRITVSSPAVWRPFSKFNEGKAYEDQIKPFNFLLSCHVNSFGHPMGSNPEKFHLIAPYESDSRRWLKMEWIDQYSGKKYPATTNGYFGDRRNVRVKTYGDVLAEYEFHPETKNADAGGNPSGKQTIGLLQRRHVRIKQIKYIGKESNLIEDVESGLVHSEADVYTEYVDPRRDEWQTKILPALKQIPLNQLVELSGMSRSALKELRAGRSRPHRKNQNLLSLLLRED